MSVTREDAVHEIAAKRLRGVGHRYTGPRRH